MKKIKLLININFVIYIYIKIDTGKIGLEPITIILETIILPIKLFSLL